MPEPAPVPAPAAPPPGLAGLDEITLVVAQSPRYYPHVDRHLKSLRKVFPKVRLLYWEKDPAEPLHDLAGVEVHRVVLPFGKGGTAFFARLMAAFTWRLLRLRPRAVEAIDPYALIPARLAAFRFPCRIAYFSMEYFPGLPSLMGKPVKRAIWRVLERWGAGKAAAVAAVCDSISLHMGRDLGREGIVTVRNVPERSHAADTGALHARCGLPPGTPIVLYQGMLQEGRGLEDAVDAVAGLPSLHLALVGPGPLMEGLRARARAAGCADRVHLLGEIPSRDLAGLTPGAWAGLAPFQAISPSYLYSLPGKVFEYIQAGVPVVASDLPEIRRVVEGYQVGYCVSGTGPGGLAAALRDLAGGPGGGREGRDLRANLAKAKAELCWEAEEAAYLSLYR